MVGLYGSSKQEVRQGYEQMVNEHVKSKNLDFTINHMDLDDSNEVKQCAIYEKLQKNQDLYQEVVWGISDLYHEMEIGLLEESELEAIEFIIDNECLTFDFL